MFELKCLTAVLPILSLALAEPQWPWQNSGQGSSPQWGQGQQPAWGQNQPWGQQQQQPRPNNPYQPANNPFGQQQTIPAAPGGSLSTVWIPNPYKTPSAGQPGAQPPFGGQAPRPTPTKPSDDDDEPRWTPPPQWGPKGGRPPFGPKSSGGAPGQPAITAAPVPGKQTTRPDYCSNTDLICTTTIDPPREPVPFKVTCGRTLYLEDDVSNALTAGCYYVKQNKKIAGSEYPKEFVNQGGRFDFGPYVKGQLYEMPLIGSAAYAGGPVGPDRVVFSMPDCFLAGELTTQNQRTGGYSECTEQY